MCKTSSDSEPGENEAGEDSYSEEESITIRAKWSMDNAKTIDEAIEKLQEYIEYLRSLKSDGWELNDPIEDDYGFLYKKDPEVNV
jgi:hypothetical protein